MLDTKLIISIDPENIRQVEDLLSIQIQNTADLRALASVLMQAGCSLLQTASEEKESSLVELYKTVYYKIRYNLTDDIQVPPGLRGH